MTSLYIVNTDRKKLSATIAGILFGLSVSVPVLAFTSAPTDTVLGHIPVITGGAITVTDTNSNGVVDIGDVLTIDPATIVFSDPDQDPQASTPYTYSWDEAGNEIGTGTSYTLKASDLGKTIKLKVKGYTDSASTDPYESTAIDAKFEANVALGIAANATSLKVANGSDVTNVVITGFGTSGKPEVGVELSADVTLADGSSGTAATLDYKWQIEDAVGSGTYKDISSATSEKYTPTKDDQKKKIRVDVTLKKP